MLGLGRLFGKRERPASAQGGQSDPDRDFSKPAHFDIDAAALSTSPDALRQALAHAIARREAGEGYGSALYFELRKVAQNAQFIDEMVDELPNTAFGSRPSEDFAFMAHNWVRATEEGEGNQFDAFKQIAMLAGWRPGDANAYWLAYQTGLVAPLPDNCRDPLGRDRLGENIALGESEIPAYRLLAQYAEQLEEPTGHA